MDKEIWLKYFRDFLRQILEYKTIRGATPQALTTFKTNAAAFAKYIVGKFDDLNLTLYTPKDYDCENSIVYSYWRDEEDPAPVFIFYLDGMKFFKV